MIFQNDGAYLPDLVCFRFIAIRLNIDKFGNTVFPIDKMICLPFGTAGAGLAVRADHSGILPCFFKGVSMLRFFESISKLRAMRSRVSCGSITSLT